MRNGSLQRAAVRKNDGGSWIGEDDPIPPEDRAQVGSQPDLDELYRAHASRLTRFLARRTGSRDDAQDLVQDVFSRFAGLGQAKVNTIERPEAYLNRVTRNLLRNLVKTKSRRSAHLHVVADNESLAGPDQQRLLESRDMLRRLEAAMLKLKPKTREIFMAHRLDGMSYAEIAERTGLSMKGVEKQMSKAIAHIDRTLDRP